MSWTNSTDHSADLKIVQLKPTELGLTQADGRIAIRVTEQSGLLASLSIDEADAQFLIMELNRLLQSMRMPDRPAPVLKAARVIQPQRWSGGPTIDGKNIVVRFESDPADYVDLLLERRYVSDLGAALLKLADTPPVCST